MPVFELDGVGVETPENGQYWIAPTAVVLGRVRIGVDASVWFNAVLRGDNELISIGARSNIQDGSVLHTDPGFPLDVGEDCTIGHMVMLHGCKIGHRSLIGIGSVILNGAEIGDECVVGAKTLIPEGKAFPARSLILGSPGRVVRTLSDDDVARFTGGAARYVTNWKRFAAGLKPQP